MKSTHRPWLIKLLRIASAYGSILGLAAACDDYTCSDTATCAVATDGGAEPTYTLTPTSSSAPSPVSPSSFSPPTSGSASPSGAFSSNEDEVVDDTSQTTAAGSEGTVAETSSVTTSSEQSISPTGPSMFDIGTACEAADECESGYCVDGVCCETSCTGTCAACAIAGSEGICSVPESDEACPKALCPEDTECLTHSESSLPSRCAGLNTCETDALCESNATPSGTPCRDGAGECNGAGECIVPNKKALGDSCEDASECGSGACAERSNGETVCCDSACDGVCQDCSNTGYCNVKPDDDESCGVLDCPNDTSCAEYPSDVTEDRCAAFGQCKVEESVCTAEYEPNGASCGESMICDGSGNCQNCPSQTGGNRTCTTECPCDAGDGICSSHSHCAAGLVCVTGGAVKHGFTGNTCLPAHCDNNLQDDDESSVDCGGDCGCGAVLDMVTLPATLSGISDDGGAVVAFSSGQASRYAYLWEGHGQYSILSTSHTARGISGDGRVVIGEGTTYPVRWVNKGQPQNLLAAPQYTNGSVLAISRDGARIGGSANSYAAGFVWTQGAVTAVSSLSWFRDMTADGNLLIGFSSDGALKFWTPSGGTTTATPPNGVSFASSDLPDMSANGRYIVGPSVLWDRTQNTTTQLRTVPDISASPYAAQVTDGGMVVGQACRNCDGVYWTAEDGYEPHRFIEFMARYGVELPPGLTLGPVRLASPNGKSFAGEIFSEDLILWRLRVNE